MSRGETPAILTFHTPRPYPSRAACIRWSRNGQGDGAQKERCAAPCRQSPSWPETKLHIRGSPKMILTTIYNHTNITSFQTTTILSASVRVDSQQISPSVNIIATTVSPRTVLHTTSLISNPQLSNSKAVSKSHDISSDYLSHGDD